MNPTPKPSILFLCSRNSCRSQMAEGWLRTLKGDRFEAFSAGLERSRVDPRAIQVMAEAGIDISGQYSKQVDDLGREFDFVVTVCDHASEHCPFFPAKTRLLHKGFEDPPKLAKGARGEEEALSHYRRVRDEIRRFVESIDELLYQE